MRVEAVGDVKFFADEGGHDSSVELFIVRLGFLDDVSGFEFFAQLQPDLLLEEFVEALAFEFLEELVFQFILIHLNIGNQPAWKLIMRLYRSCCARGGGFLGCGRTSSL